MMMMMTMMMEGTSVKKSAGQFNSLCSIYAKSSTKLYDGRQNVITVACFKRVEL
jgi:hypothetical protein